MALDGSVHHTAMSPLLTVLLPHHDDVPATRPAPSAAMVVQVHPALWLWIPFPREWDPCLRQTGVYAAALSHLRCLMILLGFRRVLEVTTLHLRGCFLGGGASGWQVASLSGNFGAFFKVPMSFEFLEFFLLLLALRQLSGVPWDYLRSLSWFSCDN